MKIWGFMRTKLLYVYYGQNYYSQNSHLNYNTDLLPITLTILLAITPAYQQSEEQ